LAFKNDAEHISGAEKAENRVRGSVATIAMSGRGKKTTERERSTAESGGYRNRFCYFAAYTLCFKAIVINVMEQL